MSDERPDDELEGTPPGASSASPGAPVSDTSAEAEQVSAHGADDGGADGADGVDSAEDTREWLTSQIRDATGNATRGVTPATKLPEGAEPAEIPPARRLPSAASFFGEPRPPRHSAHVDPVPAEPVVPVEPAPVEPVPAEPAPVEPEAQQHTADASAAVEPAPTDQSVAVPSPAARDSGESTSETLAAHPLALDLSGLPGVATPPPAGGAFETSADEPPLEPWSLTADHERLTESGSVPVRSLHSDVGTGADHASDDIAPYVDRDDAVDDEAPTSAFGALFGDLPLETASHEVPQESAGEPTTTAFEPPSAGGPVDSESFTNLISIPSEQSDQTSAPSVFDWKALGGENPTVASPGSLPVDVEPEDARVDETGTAAFEHHGLSVEPPAPVESEPVAVVEPEQSSPEPRLDDVPRPAPVATEQPPVEPVSAVEPVSPVGTVFQGADGAAPTPPPWWVTDRLQAAADERAAAEAEAAATASSEPTFTELLDVIPAAEPEGSGAMPVPRHEAFEQRPESESQPESEPEPEPEPEPESAPESDIDRLLAGESLDDEGDDDSITDVPTEFLPVVAVTAVTPLSPLAEPEAAEPEAVEPEAAERGAARPEPETAVFPTRLSVGTVGGDTGAPGLTADSRRVFGAPADWRPPVQADVPRADHGGGFSSWTPQRKRLLAIGVLLLFVVVLVLLFIIGRTLASGGDSSAASATVPATTSATPTASETPTATPTPAPTVAPAVGPLPAGPHAWNALQGGECLSTFQSAWQLTYDVVDCATAHPAQMISTGALPQTTGAAYPGDTALQSQVGLLCSAPTAISLSAASAYSDVQISDSYPATAAAWNAGSRTYYCFASRSSGQPLTGSIAAG